MCDTWVAMPNSTLAKSVIFAKNSDRPIFDCQPLLFRPREEWPANSGVKTTYLEIPQVGMAYAHLGSSPYWCWGYEEGINEFGLVIGNEAIFTRTFRQAAEECRLGRGPDLGLLGMDLIRLALERCRTAQQAVELIGSLVEQYGQFGSGSPGKSHAEGGYDNAFIVADPREVWILEAAGQCWAAKRVVDGFSSISNQPSIRTGWDQGSSDLVDHSVRRGWWPVDQKESFDFARAYIDEKVPRQLSHIRAMRSRQLLAEKDGQITVDWMKRIARDHYEDTFLQGPYLDPGDPDFLSLCMHVSPADFTWGNTASSCVAVLPKAETGLPVFWWTPGPPCNGCYVPFFVSGSKIPEIVSRPGTFGKKVVQAPQAGEDRFASDSYWWLFRRLEDCVKGDSIRSLPDYYPRRNPQVRARFDLLEKGFEAEIPRLVERAAALRSSDPVAAAHILDEFTEACVSSVLLAVEDLLREFGGL
jgi:secernin